MILKRIFLVLLILTLPSKLIGDTDIDDNNHQFNLYFGNFDFSDDKQKATLLGFQHQNENLNRNTFLGNISPVTGGFITENSAEKIVGTLKDIEKKIGRKDRSKKFSDREIDIDLLLYGKYVGKALGKDIPHKDIDLYRFVLEPLAEIAPDLIHPKHQVKISEIWKNKLNSFA